MSKLDRQKKRALRRGAHAKPSAPRVIGANDNAVNDNDPVVVGGVTLNARLSAEFRKAEENLASNDLARRREGHQAMMEIELAITQGRDAKWAQAVRKEMAALEKARGGELTVEKARDQRGQDGEVVRVKRDGLATLSASRKSPDGKTTIPPALSRLETIAGLRYRADYERIDPERRLSPPDPLRTGKATGGDGFDKKVAESWRRVRVIHLMIAGVPQAVAERTGGDEHTRPQMPGLPASHPSMRAIHALEEIAGKGKNVSQLVGGGRAHGRMVDDLKRALRQAMIVYGLG